MPVGYVDSTASGSSDAQSATTNVPVPSGAASGHIALLIGELWLDTATNPVVTYPSGFTQIVNFASTTDGFEKLKVAWKRLTAADSGNYQVGNLGNQWNMWHCIMISGALAAGDPIDFIDTDATSTSGTALPVMSGTATGADFVVDAIANENAASSTPSTNYTEAEDGSYLHTNYRILSGSGTETTASGSLSTSTLKLRALIGIKPAAGGGSVDLVIQDASIGIAADNITITQVHALNIQESGITMTVDNVVITQNHLIIVQDAAIPVAAENLTISQHIQLAIDKAVMVMRADTSSFQQVHQISIHKAFLQTAADVVNMSGEEEGGIVTVADVQVQKLQTLTGTTGTISDLMHAYYGGLSGLTPIPRFSISDHQRVYWEAQTGLSNRSLADLEKAFYDAQLVPSGSLADREYVYWSNL